MRATLLLVALALGCARATVAADLPADGSPPADGSAGGEGEDGAAAGVDARRSDTMMAGTDLARAADAGAPLEDGGFIPPSRRDGGIPPRPPGDPPCAPDSMAGNGNACPYQAIVGCTTPATNGRPAQTCICLAPPLGGKWSCDNARDAGAGN